jgi:hypothetical protein
VRAQPAAVAARVAGTVLLPLLRHDDERVSGAAVAAICCAAEPAHGSAIHHSSVPALLGCLSSAAAWSVLAALEALAASKAGRRVVVREPGAGGCRRLTAGPCLYRAFDCQVGVPRMQNWVAKPAKG